MKRQLVLFLLLLACMASYAQNNLVLNHSFEDDVRCPIGPAGLNDSLVNHWTNASGSPDYFRQCADSTSRGWFGVPDNAFGYEFAEDGLSYIGEVTYAPEFPSYREYAEGSLRDTLRRGNLYLIRYYVSMADLYPPICISNVGAYFSDTLIKYSGVGNMGVTAQFQNDTNNLIRTVVGWQKIEGSFIAHGGERYIVLGNFTPDSLVQVSNCKGPIPIDSDVYIYFDNVSVIDTSIIDTIHLCQFDSVQIGNQWHKTEGLYYDTVAGIPVREYLQNYPHPAYFTHVDLPFHAGDSARAGYVWMYTDSVLVLHFNSITGCDSTVYYHCRTNVGIEDALGQGGGISIYPNPAVHSIIINTKHFDKAYSWALYDLQGRLIQTYSITHKEEEITLPENMAAGLYYWKLVPAEPLGASRDGVLLNWGKLLVE